MSSIQLLTGTLRWTLEYPSTVCRDDPSMKDSTIRIKTLRYQIMLALYLPVLLYAFSTFDISEDTAYIRDVEPIVVGQENVVLGQPYEASAYLTASGATNIEVQTDDERLQIDGERLSMQTGTLLPEGENEQVVEYTAELLFEQVNGDMASRSVTGQFTVRRPEVIAQSVAADALYRQTLNEVRISVPGLENQPLRLVSGGQSQEGRTLSLSPSEDQVSVDAYLVQSEEDDVFLGTRTFNVIQPPLPSVRVLNAGGDELQASDRVSLARPNIQFDFEPDPEFASRYAQDARYSIGRVRVSYRRGLGASQELGTFELGSDNQLNLAGQLRGLQPDDTIFLELENVARINHANQRIPLDNRLGSASQTFSFALSG